MEVPFRPAFEGEPTKGSLFSFVDNLLVKNLERYHLVIINLQELDLQEPCIDYNELI